MFQKIKRTRLKGKALKKLCEEVYWRDDGLCVNCSRFVELGVKPHHEPLKSQGGQDRLEGLVMLCNSCHYLRHNDSTGIDIGKTVEAYLLEKYPEKNDLG